MRNPDTLAHSAGVGRKATITSVCEIDEGKQLVDAVLGCGAVPDAAKRSHILEELGSRQLPIDAEVLR